MIVDLFQRRIWLGPLLGIVIGLLIGLLIGWSTVDFKAARDDVRMVAEAYATNNNAALAKARLASKRLATLPAKTELNRATPNR